MNSAASIDYIAFAHTLADKAGDIARRYFRAKYDSSLKQDKSPVTQADQEIEHALRAIIMEKFPAHGIYGEEEERHLPAAMWQWVIDPIDGTRAFMAGIPTFTTLIALVENNEPILGLIDQPISKERWLNVKGERHIKTRVGDMMSDALISTTSTYYFNFEQTLAFERLRASTRSVLLGGDAYAYAMLASGYIDIVIDANMKPYDFCALKNVVEGAGGVITDWTGKPLALNSDGNVVAAANAKLHQEALQIIQGK